MKLLFILALTLTSLKAAIINVNGTNYDITTQSGTYTELQTTFESQPWWGSSPLAEQAASDIGTLLGLPNGLGPYFAHERTATSTRGFAFDSEAGAAVGIGVFDPAGNTQTRTWAIVNTAAAVPEPSIALFTISSLGMLFIRKRHINNQ